MHELRIASEVISIVQEEIDRRGLHKVEAVGLRLGALSGVNPDALSFSFEAATIDTPLARTELIIEQIPVRGNCRSCGRDFQIEEFVFICPHCGSTDMEITRGEELDLQYLIGE